MNARFSATPLDLSRFPPPLAIRGIDLEGVIIPERKARLLELFAAAGIPFDVEDLEFDPAVILQQLDGGRELLAYAAINDSVRAVLVAFATGADLDHLAAFYGVTRMVIAPATNNAPAVMESDAEFRRRVLLAPEAFGAAGPIGAYVFHALSADPMVLNADVWSPGPGEVSVAIQSREGDGTASEETLQQVRAHLRRDDIKPLTDDLGVASVVNHPYQISVEVFIAPGPDPQTVRDEVEASLAAMAAGRRTPARDVPRSAVYAAASIGPVDRVVVNQPTSDIARGNGEVGIVTAIDVTVTVYG